MTPPLLHRWAHLWPRSLIGRLGVVLFGAVLLAVIGNAIVLVQAEQDYGDETQTWHIAEQVETAGHVLSAIQPERRAAVADSLSSPFLTFTWVPNPAERANQGDNPASWLLRHEMIEHRPALAGLDLRLRTGTETPSKTFDGDLRLTDGSILRFGATDLPAYVPVLYAQLGSIALLSIGVLLMALFLVQTLAAPLKMLVKAADAVGNGPPVFIPARGPQEIRRVALAFNAMQRRIDRLITSRTEALAAVSHDMRTPIGRLRLRAGFLSSAEERAAFDSDLDEMEGMVNDLLDYLGGEEDPERPRRTDLPALLSTLVDNAVDAGHAARYDGPDRLPLTLRPLGMRRAFSNIINNAITYGGGARVTVRDTAKAAVVSISDDGPGIPEAQFEAVFEPFHRLEESRNRGTGGTGLGLTIARQAVTREGGSIALKNRPEGGLTVIVSIPKQDEAAQKPTQKIARHTLS
ncbi:ATP-binding protein [Nitrospirillum sp. BR 11828]|uniref:ATP-binding protein n=1 Tax=Nitrospirillum sp. BR 11828 TaxID=3104325 RepID=UPI002ACADF83|nr:ATP-binding protein [Nitrospirillum sp. BR 11828]MDZ5648500.1 ATP-binding protein [Nitrospirillum sp. BR 11828]